jgi:NADH-quinone oxidoreductase subunit C/D
VNEPPGAGATGEPSGAGESSEPASLPGAQVPSGAGSATAAGDPLAVELRQELGEEIVEVAGGGEAGAAAAAGAGGDLTLEVRREDVARVAAALRSRFRYAVLVDLCAVDYPDRPLRFEIVYHLYSFRENRRIRIKVRTGERSPVPSATGIWRGAAWPESEAHDLFGIEFEGHSRPGRILLWEGFDGHPLRKDFPLAGIDTGAGLSLEPLGPDDIPVQRLPPAASPGDPRGAGEVVELAFGPRHPALQGVLRLRLTLDGDTVAECQPRIGYGHRGLEKLAEGFSLLDGVALTDRLDFAAAAAANLAYCGAVERLLGVEAPPRARRLRVVLAELQRIASHLLWLATHAADAGVEAAFLPCLGDRERVLDLLAAWCGARLTLRCAVPGGLPREPPDGWLASCAELAAALPARMAVYERLLGDDRSWKQRTVGLGVLSSETALDYGVTGPMLRATGVDWDLRKALPYDGYDELDFEVPTARNGDAFDRGQVRLAEVRQAAGLVVQCLERLPPGPVLLDPPPAALVPPPGAETYFSVEGPRGEIGFYLAAAPAGAAGADPARPWRCRVRAPSFYNLQVLPELVRGHGVADLVVLLGSLDLALGEVDR